MLVELPRRYFVVYIKILRSLASLFHYHRKITNTVKVVNTYVTKTSKVGINNIAPVFPKERQSTRNRAYGS